MERRRQQRTPRNLLSSLPHFPSAIVCAALLMLGAGIQSAMAKNHRVGLEELGYHYDAAPLVPVLFLMGAIGSGAWPVFRGAWRSARLRRLAWQQLVAIVIVGAVALGHLLEAATLALVTSIILNVTGRRVTDAS